MAFRFKNFSVYQDARKIHIEIVLCTNTFPKNYFFLIDQIRRSSLSILLNIAEGSSRQSDKDFNRFITIALGSVDETVACLDIALALKLITPKVYRGLEEQCSSICKQLGGFSKSLKH